MEDAENVDAEDAKVKASDIEGVEDADIEDIGVEDADVDVEDVDNSDTAKEDASQSVISQIKETVTTIIWAVGIAVILRTFLFQPFHIPSGSMLPGLMKGDYIITSKYSLGYGKYAATPLPFPRKKGRLFERLPERGDVIVFRPEGDDKNFIKRLVGLPGDKVQMIDGILHINGQSVKMKLIETETMELSGGRKLPAERWAETFASGQEHFIFDAQKNHERDNTSVRTVPAGYYFMMGDNRDFSSDSRVPVRAGGAGFVPATNLMGKAEIVLLSVDNEFSLFKPWTWGHMRGSRFFKSIG